MKKLILFLLVALLSVSAFTQNIIQLPAPEKEGGKPLMEALNDRSSSRNFTGRELSQQTLSDLLWAAFGINREESGKRTAPTSHNVQDIDIYLSTKEGAFLYLPKKHALQQVVQEDVRAFMGKQDFTATAALNLVYVSDFSKYERGNETTKKRTASAHCGFIGQNVYLFCASQGLSTVFRAWIDPDVIHKKLGLQPHQHVIYSQTVGYPE